MVKKSVTTILGVSQSQASWWRKPGSKVHSPTSQSDVAPVRGVRNENVFEVANLVTIEMDIEGLKINNKNGPIVSTKN